MAKTIQNRETMILRLVLAFSLGVILPVLLLSKLGFLPHQLDGAKPVSISERHKARSRSQIAAANRVAEPATNAPDKAETTRPKLSPENEKEAKRERDIRVKELQGDEKILNARSYNVRVDAYCRAEMGSPARPLMAMTGGLSGDEAEALYNTVLVTDVETREQEQKRQMLLQQLEYIVTNYEKGVAECKWGVLNGLEKMPSDSEYQQEIAGLKAEILDIDRNGPQVVPIDRATPPDRK